jgi:hypothetical protein
MLDKASHISVMSFHRSFQKSVCTSC